MKGTAKTHDSPSTKQPTPSPSLDLYTAGPLAGGVGEYRWLMQEMDGLTLILPVIYVDECLLGTPVRLDDR